MRVCSRVLDDVVMDAATDGMLDANDIVGVACDAKEVDKVDAVFADKD